MPNDTMPGFNIDEWEKDPKHETARKNFDAMVASSLSRKKAEQDAADKKKREEENASIPFPFNLFVGK